MTTKIFVSQIDKTNPDGSTAANGSFLIIGSSGPYWAGGAGAQPVGYTGSVGYLGSTGSAGYIGSVGYTGSFGGVGYIGSIGFSGSVGGPGTQGDIGFQGSYGHVGHLGSTGYQGSIGSPGPAGIGFQGSFGDTGYMGSVGYVGFQGSVGNSGYVGSVGGMGVIGFQGSVGNAGAGYKGSIGDVGMLGDNGFQGSVGYTGSSGVVAFTTLIDAPNTYVSQAFLRVNSSATGIVFDTNTYITNTAVTDISMNYNTLWNPVFLGYGEYVNHIGNATVAGFGFTPTANGNITSVTLTDSVVGVTIGSAGMINGKLYTVVMFITQDSTGNRTIDWSALNVKWPTAENIPPSGPVLSVNPGYTDIITLYTMDAGATWYGVLAVKGFSN